MEDKKTESLFENEGVNPFDANYGQEESVLSHRQSLDRSTASPSTIGFFAEDQDNSKNWGETTTTSPIDEESQIYQFEFKPTVKLPYRPASPVPHRPYNPYTSTPAPFSPATTMTPNHVRFAQPHPFAYEDSVYDPKSELGTLQAEDEKKYGERVPSDLDGQLAEGARQDGFEVRGNDTFGAASEGDEPAGASKELYRALGDFFLRTRVGQILLSLTSTVVGVFAFRVACKYVLANFSLPLMVADALKWFLRWIPPSPTDLWRYLKDSFTRMEEQVAVQQRASSFVPAPGGTRSRSLPDLPFSLPDAPEYDPNTGHKQTEAGRRETRFSDNLPGAAAYLEERTCRLPDRPTPYPSQQYQEVDDAADGVPCGGKTPRRTVSFMPGLTWRQRIKLEEQEEPGLSESLTVEMGSRKTLDGSTSSADRALLERSERLEKSRQDNLRSQQPPENIAAQGSPFRSQGLTPYTNKRKGKGHPSVHRRLESSADYRVGSLTPDRLGGRTETLGGTLRSLRLNPATEEDEELLPTPVQKTAPLADKEDDNTSSCEDLGIAKNNKKSQ